MTFNEESVIANASEGWQKNLLYQQAKGRFVEKEVLSKFGLQKASSGVDIKGEKMNYEILSGTKSNIDRHSKRMSDVTYRLITF